MFSGNEWEVLCGVQNISGIWEGFILVVRISLAGKATTFDIKKRSKDFMTDG